MDSTHAGIKGANSRVQPKGKENSLKDRNALLADKDLPRNPKLATSRRSSNLPYDQPVTFITHSTVGKSKQQFLRKQTLCLALH